MSGLAREPALPTPPPPLPVAVSLPMCVETEREVCFTVSLVREIAPSHVSHCSQRPRTSFILYSAVVILDGFVSYLTAFLMM